MTHLQWQDASSKDASGAPPPPSTHSTLGASTGNLWFAVSVGLMGLIVGFAIGMARTGAFPVAIGNPQPTAQAPIVPPAPTPPAAPETPAAPDDDITLGKADAPITLIEFSDFQCPFCRRFWRDTLPTITKEYIDAGKVKFVYRDFPLSFHPGADPAARAMECAADQSDTLAWKLHDVIFAEQQKQGEGTIQFTADDVKKWALAVPSLNQQTFTSCFDSNTHADEVQKDIADGSAAGISGTPGFWILGPNGKSQKISGAYPYETFVSAFDSMLP